MKKIVLLAVFAILAFGAKAQIKVHNNGRITFLTLNNTVSEGIAFSPGTNSNADFNTDCYFKNNAYFVKPAGAFAWINCTAPQNALSCSWVVTYPDFVATTFYVRGDGHAYGKGFHVVSSMSREEAKGYEPIGCENALELVKDLEGYYCDPQEMEIPDLEHNEQVDPEAIEAMYADFAKRTAELSPEKLEAVFPEAVRTDHQNRQCIDYAAVTTVLVEAVKAQQQQIELLRKTLEENGLMEP